MPMTFIPHESSAFDEGSAVSILRPRIAPEDNEKRIEYQYTFLKGDERIGGIGLGGSQSIITKNGNRTWEFRIEITHKSEIEMLLNFKKKINNKDDEIDFIKSMANGLIAAFESRQDADMSYRYLVLTTPWALAQNNIPCRGQADQEMASTFILAESNIPARTMGNQRS